MNRGFFSLFRQDLVLSWRGGLVTVTLITLVLITVLYWLLPFLVPEDPSLNQSQLFLDNTENRMVEHYLRDHGADDSSFAESRDDLIKRVEQDSTLVGIAVSGDSGKLSWELVCKSAPGEQTVNMIKAVLSGITESVSGTGESAKIKIEQMNDEAEPVGVNQQMIVIMLVFEVMILGFLFVAVVVFGEKKEGSIRAYRVSPSGLGNYVISKTLVFTLLSTLYGIVLITLTIGIHVRFPALFLILFLSCAFMTVLGLGIAVFFKNISEWFVPGVLILFINMLSILPYQMPAYSNRLFALLPGYSVIFGIDQILFPTGREGFMGPLVLKLVVQLVLAGGFALWAVNRRMMKES